MKKLYLSALSMFSALAFYAQPQLNQGNHAPVAGNQFQKYQCDSSINITATGGGQTWNFSSLNTHFSLLTTNTVNTNSNPSYTNANITVTSTPAASAYYQTSATDLKYWGGDQTLGGQPATLTFSSPAVYMAYPTSLGTFTNSTIGGSVNVLGNPGTFTGVCTVTANATGTLIVPSFTLPNTIKVLTTVGINGTVGPFTVSATQITNEFYSPADSKYPILSVVASTITSPLGTSVQKTAYVQKAFTPVGIKEISKDENHVVYPNPASSEVNFLSVPATLEVFDLTGKLIESKRVEGMYSLNVSNYANGLYIYKLTSENKNVSTGKFAVTH